MVSVMTRVLTEPPSLAGIDRVWLNFETDGLDWRRGNKPIAIAVCLPDGSAHYLPWGHRGDSGRGNLDETAVKRWACAELRDKRIVNVNIKFDVHMAMAWGVDLETQGNTVGDVAHYAALLDDHRRKFNLDQLVRDFLAEEPLVRLDESRMTSHSVVEAEPRALYNVETVRRLEEIMQPRMSAMGLDKVAALEDDVIFAACEMERNAAPIDVEKLYRWEVEAEEQLDAMRKQIAKALGRTWVDNLFGGPADADQFLNPDSSKDMEKLFHELELPMTYLKTGSVSFTKEVLARIDHPIIKLVVRQSRLLDLLSKYLSPYADAVRRDDVLHFNLHQCRNDEHGTVRGRFSASDKNIQQVMKPKKQRELYGDEFIIRELFVPGDGMLLLSADAEQIEYRIFAHYANKRSVIEAFLHNPHLDFHELTCAEMRKVRPSIDRDKAKTLNFLTVYGGGLPKLALALGTITTADFMALYDEFPMDPDAGKWGPPREHPKLAEAVGIKDIYDRALPEVGPLSRRATKLAKERGWVVDCLGRRATFPGGWKAHAALNAVIQPSAAEINKMKVIEIHKERKRLGLVPRMTVHDEWVGDCPSLESAKGLAEILNRQSFPFRVPITWDLKWGMNWAMTSKDESQFANTVMDGTRGGRSRKANG